MKLQINCPQCSATGVIAKLDNVPCTYCEGQKQVSLVSHLRVTNHEEKLANVLDYQRRHNKRTKPKQ
jgi:DnaJ-class molecular chaperone